MRFRSISLLSVVGFVGVACGGGSGGAPVATGKGTSQNGDASYQAPPSTYEPPSVINPRTYEPPPGSFDAPPGQTNAGGVGTGPSLTDVWSRVCNEVLALNCDFSSLSSDTGNNGNQGNNPQGNSASSASAMSSMTDAQACAQAGEALSAEIPCPDEYAAALACILDNITITCDLFSSAADNQSIEQDIAATCQAPVLAFAQCEGSTGQVSQPQPTGRCEIGSCIGCGDQCSTCLCQNYDDPSLCPICANQ